FGADQPRGEALGETDLGGKCERPPAGGLAKRPGTLVQERPQGLAGPSIAAERHPFLFQAVRAQIRGVARLGSATAEHLVEDGLHVAILVPRMALLEGPPVIAEDLLEGVSVDPLPCGCHRAWLYHVLASRSTRLCPLIRLSLPIVSPCSDG